MSMSKIDYSGGDLEPHVAPGNFERDEIQWEENEYPVRPDLIPFRNSTKKIRKELEQSLAPAEQES